jgi:hypothetical protein
MNASFDQRAAAVERRLRRARERYGRSNKGVTAALVHALQLSINQAPSRSA